MKSRKVRDLVIVDINEKERMVIACDSSGSIGNKRYDLLQVEPFITGKYTVRVGLLEILCSGAEVITIVDNVCAEMEPTGREIIRGINSELKLAKIDDVPLTGSTEENFEVFATGVGITVIGIIDKDKLKVNNIKSNSVIYSIGIPKVGDEIDFYNDNDIFGYETLYDIKDLEGVYEIVPVGSKGILYEAISLATNNGKKFIQNENLNVDIKRSCGPATVVIVAIDKSLEDYIKGIKNSCKIGEII